jgi:ATP-dependent Clp protease ATP-binding subunit ClpA
MISSTYRYSHHALRALTHASTLAEGFQHAHQDTGHLLLGIVLAEGSIGAQALEDAHFDATVAGVYLKRLMARVEENPHPPRGEAFEKSLAEASLESTWLASHYIGTEHLLLGITRTNLGNAPELLRLQDIAPEQIRRRLRDLLQNRPPQFDLNALRANTRLSELARRVLSAAEQNALALEHPSPGIGHLLLALAQERRGVTSDMLNRSGLDTAQLEASIERRDENLLESMDHVMRAAIDEASRLGSHYLGADHLLLALTLTPIGTTLLQSFGAAPDKVGRLLNKHLGRD